MPKTNIENVNRFKFENLLALKLKTEMSQGRRSPLFYVLSNAAMTALIYSVFFGILLFYDYHKQKEVMQIASQLRQDVNDIKKESQDVLDSSRKFRLLMMARLNDYAKELSFWRDTIRRVIYAAGDGKEHANNLIKKVQKGLRTYKADLKIIDEFESIKMMADITRDSQEQRNKPETN